MESNDPGQSSATKETTGDNVVQLHVAAEAAPAADYTPTREEARDMFKESPGLWAVLTTEGNLTRDQC